LLQYQPHGSLPVAFAYGTTQYGGCCLSRRDHRRDAYFASGQQSARWVFGCDTLESSTRLAWYRGCSVNGDWLDFGVFAERRLASTSDNSIVGA